MLETCGSARKGRMGKEGCTFPERFADPLAEIEALRSGWQMPRVGSAK